MEKSGWEIRPIAWLVLAILLGAVIHYMWRWQHRRSLKNKEKT